MGLQHQARHYHHHHYAIRKYRENESIFSKHNGCLDRGAGHYLITPYTPYISSRALIIGLSELFAGSLNVSRSRTKLSCVR